MITTCPHCGATFPSGETCSRRFDATQMMELGDPAYYAVHHLSVPCYMLQHHRTSREGWLAVRHLLHQFIYEGLTPAQARRQNRDPWDSERRRWSLTRGAKLTKVDNVVWTRTIADVRIDTAEHYGTDVRGWAIAVLADTATLVTGLDSKG